LEQVGHGIGMTVVIYGLVRFKTEPGTGSMFQQVDEYVRTVFGDQSECDRAVFVEKMRGLLNVDA
jgi:hypothetical protein